LKAATFIKEAAAAGVTSTTGAKAAETAAAKQAVWKETHDEALQNRKQLELIQTITKAKNKNFPKKIGRDLLRLDEELYGKHEQTQQKEGEDPHEKIQLLSSKFNGFDDNQREWEAPRPAFPSC